MNCRSLPTSEENIDCPDVPKLLAVVKSPPPAVEFIIILVPLAESVIPVPLVIFLNCKSSPTSEENIPSPTDPKLLALVFSVPLTAGAFSKAVILESRH